MDIAPPSPMPPPMTQAEFFPWAQQQGLRYEFDGVRPVAMTGGNLGHNDISGHLRLHLGMGLRGRPCRFLGPDAGVSTIGATIRYPDAVVTCSTYGPKDYLVPNPVIVFEVVSPTSGRMDRVIKLREYNAVPSIRRYIVVESESPAVTVLAREQAGEAFTASGLSTGDTLTLPEIGIELPVAAIYEGMTFETILG